MKRGFRPAFYNEDPFLHSIEILAWAVKQPCFSLGDVLRNFKDELRHYADATHEASERLRKLVRSGMIVALVGPRLAALKIDDEKTLVAINERIRVLAMESFRRRGRPARAYRITNAGRKQVARRKDDLERIAEAKEKRVRG